MHHPFRPQRVMRTFYALSVSLFNSQQSYINANLTVFAVNRC